MFCLVWLLWYIQRWNLTADQTLGLVTSLILVWPAHCCFPSLGWGPRTTLGTPLWTCPHLGHSFLGRQINNPFFLKAWWTPTQHFVEVWWVPTSCTDKVKLSQWLIFGFIHVLCFWFINRKSQRVSVQFSKQRGPAMCQALPQVWVLQALQWA